MTHLHSYAAGRDTTASLLGAPALLSVSRLCVVASTPGAADRTILDDISFQIAREEVVGVLGESGAGKSTLALALLHLLPHSLRIQGGSIHLDDRPVLELPEAELRSLRGDAMSIVFQDSSVLNPVMPVEDQVAEVFRAHRDWSTAGCLNEARATLELVGMGSERLLGAYPHQLSGGQRQRVAIAQALACRPDLLIADEPTASLDATTTVGILELLEDIRRFSRAAILLISQQPVILAHCCDRLLVMYGGQIVEQGPTHDLFNSPLHPYTRQLLSCREPVDATKANGQDKPRWSFIPGDRCRQEAPGCAFENRCLDRMEICGQVNPAIRIVEGERQVRCLKVDGGDV